MRTDEVLPCPFCTGPVHKRTMGDVEGCFHIGAPHCPVESNRMMTIEQWNTRALASSATIGEREDEAFEKLRSLRVMFVSCGQPLYVKIIDEVLAALPRPYDVGEREKRLRDMLQHPAVTASLRTLRPKYQNARCDDEAVACCARCNIMFLVRTVEDAIAALTLPDEEELRTEPSPFGPGRMA